MDPAKHGDECILVFRDRGKASGRLIDFLPDDARLKFRSREAAEIVGIAFSSLLLMQLLQPVALRRNRCGSTMEELYPPSERQPFALGLVNGKTSLGETVGSVHALCGLFLFPAEQDDDTVTRWFVPADAIRSMSIGKPLGRCWSTGSSPRPRWWTRRSASSRRCAPGASATTSPSTRSCRRSSSRRAQAQRAQPLQKLGEALVELGYLTEAELEEALAIEARDRSVPLGQILADMGVVDAPRS